MASLGTVRRSQVTVPGTVTGPGWLSLAAGRRPLLAVLAVQVALSLRLLAANTAFQDEALYLREIGRASCRERV